VAVALVVITQQPLLLAELVVAVMADATVVTRLLGL
jgi:hypothetical protein